MSLLHAQTAPVLPAMHHPIMYPLWLISLAGTALLLLWLARSLWLWRQWQSEPARQPTGWRRSWALRLRFGLPLLWALLLSGLVPAITYPLAVLRINTPDFGYTILGCTTLMVLWCLVWAGLHWFGTHKQATKT